MKFSNKMKLSEISTKSRIAIRIYGDTASKKLERDAKLNAPWTDRTSNARNSLQGDFRMEGDKAQIALSGNMEYSGYLELAMEKKYAIIIPTIRANHVNIMKNFAKVVFK